MISNLPTNPIQSHPQSNSQPNPLYPQFQSSSSSSSNYHKRSNYPISLNSNTTHPSIIKLNQQNSNQPYPLPNTILTRSDLRESIQTFENMLSTAKSYRSALMSLSSATSAFAKSLEDCARLKGAQNPPSLNHHQSNHTPNSSHTQLHDFLRNGTQDGNSSIHDDENDDEKLSPAERLMAASGLHFMTANLEQVLSATFYKSFEIPLLDVYDHYREQLAERQSTYEAEVSAKTKAIRETELRNMKQGLNSSSLLRSRSNNGKLDKQTRFLGRDLNSFRKGLKELQDQVESVEKLKQIYYLEVAGGEYEVWKSVADNISLIVKSEVDVYDRIASKATSDPTLEMMVTSIPDPFDTYNQDLNSNATQAPEIYSILPPLSSILTPAQVIARKSIQDYGQTTLSFTTPTDHETNPSYESSSVENLINPNLDSTTHWDHQIKNTTNEISPLPVMNYQCDDIEEEEEEEEEVNRSYNSTSLFNSNPPSPSLNHTSTLVSIHSIPIINLGSQTQSFTPTPLRNMVSMDSSLTESSTIKDQSISNSNLNQNSNPNPDSDQNQDQNQDQDQDQNQDQNQNQNQDQNPNEEFSQDTIKCNLSSIKRVSVLSGISLSTNENDQEIEIEDQIMSQLPPIGIDSDSDLENSFNLN